MDRIGSAVLEKPTAPAVLRKFTRTSSAAPRANTSHKVKHEKTLLRAPALEYRRRQSFVERFIIIHHDVVFKCHCELERNTFRNRLEQQQGFKSKQWSYDVISLQSKPLQRHPVRVLLLNMTYKIV